MSCMRPRAPTRERARGWKRDSVSITAATSAGSTSYFAAFSWMMSPNGTAFAKKSRRMASLIRRISRRKMPGCPVGAGSPVSAGSQRSSKRAICRETRLSGSTRESLNSEFAAKPSSTLATTSERFPSSCFTMRTASRSLRRRKWTSCVASLIPPTESAAPTARVARVVCRILREGFFIGLRSVIWRDRNPKRPLEAGLLPRSAIPRRLQPQIVQSEYLPRARRRAKDQL